MNSLLKISVATIICSAVTSCGVLQKAPLPSPTLTPLITTSGKSVAGDPAIRINNSSEIRPDALPARAMPVERIFQTDRCNQLSRGGFIWFTESVGFNDWLSPLDAEQAQQVRAKIDFSKQGVLLADFGVAGAAGAGANVIDDQLEVKGQEGLVKVVQLKPPVNKRSAQVVTHPCTLFVMPRTGYSSLVVLSELDDRLISFDNK